MALMVVIMVVMEMMRLGGARPAPVVTTTANRLPDRVRSERTRRRVQSASMHVWIWIRSITSSPRQQAGAAAMTTTTSSSSSSGGRASSGGR